MNYRSYPAIHPAYVPVRTRDAVYLLAGPWSGPVFTIRDEPTNGDTGLFDLLDGHHTYAQIVDRVGQEDSVEAVLKKLGRENVLYFLDEESSYPVHRIPIQANREPVVEQEPNDARYVLVTYGDVGGIVLDFLNDVDAAFDHVDLSGSTTVDEIELDSADFGIFLTDRFKPDVTRRFNTRALEADLPWIVGQVNGFDAVVGPTIVPGETACYQCYLDRVDSNGDDYYRLYYEGAKQVGSGSGFAPLGWMVESYVCLELAHVSQFGQGFTVERVITVSGTTLVTNIDDVLKAPRCDECAQIADRKRFVGYGDLTDLGE